MRERQLDPGASPSAHFGNEVREARTCAGMSQPELGAATDYDGSYVSKVEGAKIVPDDKFIDALDRVFPHMNGWFGRFWRDSRKWNGHYREWFKDWVAAERQASVIRWYEPLLIPGLVQTEEYARAVLSWGPLSGNVDDDVQARMERQAILDRDNPPELWVLVAESAVRRRVGNAKESCAHSLSIWPSCRDGRTSLFRLCLTMRTLTGVCRARSPSPLLSRPAVSSTSKRVYAG